MRKDVCCVGSTILDITTYPIDLPKLSSEHQKGEQTQLGPGGCAGNVSINLVGLGKDVDLVARVGSGPIGQLLRQLLKSRGVHTSHLINDSDTETGKAIVLVDDGGDRRFIYTPGANACLEPGDLVTVRTNQYQAVHISDVFLLPEVEGPPLANLLRQARIDGCITSMDTIWDPSGRWLPLLLPHLPYLDILFCSEEEACHLLPGHTVDQILDRLLKEGTRCVVLKQGEQGCSIATVSERFQVPAFETPVLDTTGAGDAFVAAFLSGILEGMGLRDTAVHATAFASHSIRFLGATGNRHQAPSLAKFVADIQTKSF